ncbi:MAG: hypothetical protein ACMXYM_00945 [Candidatus Woesearchaeota archaeon]
MRSIVVLVLALFVLTACQPDYVTSDRLEPFAQHNTLTDARHEINALALEHESRVSEAYTRLSSSEEKVAFDVVRAKRQLLGSRHSQRPDVDTMIDVHAYTAYSEIARARARIEGFDSDARAALVEQRARIDALPLETITPGSVEPIIRAAREALENDKLEGWVNTAEEASVNVARQFENELNKIRST